MRNRLVFVSVLCMLAGMLHAQSLRNPVIGGFHPDPSVCRVGDKFYLVNSSFEYFPGVPISESSDLVHWRQLGSVLNRSSQLNLQGASSWLGIYAPTIRYNEGTYYMITTNVGHGGNFLVTAKKPGGPWSNPVWLKQGGIDPSLYFENGHCYMVSNPNDGIMLCEINPTTGEQLTAGKVIWRGMGGRYPEGPHIYKKDGYYYLLISEGGTELAHHLTIARSRHIEGPYEANPANPILTNCNQRGQSMQVQGTGHGDFVQAADGSWWIVFLAYRNMGGSYHHLGRETFLAPVTWPEGGWPVINDGNPIDTLMNVRLLPQHPYTMARPSFSKDDPAWVYIQNPDSDNYQWTTLDNPVTISDKKGRKKTITVPEPMLCLHGASSLTANDRPTFIGRRQEAERVSCSVQVAPQGDSDFESGLTIYQINDGHYDFFVKPDGDSLTIWLRYEIKGLPQSLQPVGRIAWTPPLAAESQPQRPVTLRITSGDNRYTFAYAANGQTFITVGSLPCQMVSTEVVGGFTGVTLGMFATGKGQAAFTQWQYDEH